MTLTQFERPTFAVSISPEVGGAVVRLRGDADVFTLPLVVDALARAIAGHDGWVVVDLADADFIDTGNVRALARASQFLDERGRSLTLRSPSRAAARLLVLLGLSPLIERSGATSGRQPRRAKARTTARPTPALAPVTTTTGIALRANRRRLAALGSQIDRQTAAGDATRVSKAMNGTGAETGEGS